MPLLFPNLRINQVFGANTDVGKTLLTTALVRATASKYSQPSSEASTSRDTPKKRVFYLKPVSTGPDNESDVSYVLRHTGPYSDLVATKNLFQYREPMSPHLAAKLAPDLPFPVSNDELVRGVEEYTRTCVQELGGSKGALYIETAGGVHSPSLHPPHTQSTSLRPLLLPSILIASPHLGGISTTISSYESLILRGYSISAVLCLNHPYYQNHTFLSNYFKDRGVGFWNIPTPPERRGTLQEDAARLGEWYSGLAGRIHPEEEVGEGGSMVDVVNALDTAHEERIKELQSMPGRTLDSVWWPFTQHGLVNKKEDVMVIDSAFGDNFDAYYARSEGGIETAAEDVGEGSSSKVEDGGEISLLKSYFDGSASWFTQSHGHANEHLTLALASAAGRYGHVLFPSGTHQPALRLAEKLKETVGKGWADRVFYSDNGSTGMEVALKMGLRASGVKYGWSGEMGGDVGILGLRGSYHGDTIGAMDATEASTFNKAVDWYKGRGHWLSPPVVRIEDGVPTITSTSPDTWSPLPTSLTSSSSTKAKTNSNWSIPYSSIQSIYSLSTRLESDLATYYRSHIRRTLERLSKEGRKFGALVLEPICLGAGGMVFVDPLFQSCLVEVVRASSDLFDESYKGEGYEAELLTLKGRDAEKWSGLPVIYDEVFSGLNRFAYISASTILNQKPDISVYAKILTGGLLPLSTTLASKSIFNAFLSDKKIDALLHGHSYTANPVGCAVALKAIEMTEGRDFWEEGVVGPGWGLGDGPGNGDGQGKKVGAVDDEEGGRRWSLWGLGFLEDLSRVGGVKGVMSMGTVLAIELEDQESDYASHSSQHFLQSLKKETIKSNEAEFEPFQIHSRPLGNVVYLITSLWTKPAVIRAMEEVILRKAHLIGQ